MNAKLIDSLARIINSLSQEEKKLLYSKLELPPETAETSAVNLEEEPFFGMWRDREDLTDSTGWKRQHRQQEWTRFS